MIYWICDVMTVGGCLATWELSASARMVLVMLPSTAECCCPRLWKASEMTRVLLLLAWVMSVLWVGSGAVSITVGTYNLWNVMFNWDVRKHHIAEMVSFEENL